jgi:RimJ/RimL family protein N-acetyltransferase
MRLSRSLVTLRPFRGDELQTVVSARRRSGALPRDGSGVAEERLRRRVERSGTLTPHEMFLAIEAEGRLVGEVQARRSIEAPPPGVFELGFEICADADRGRGYGSDAVEVVTSHLFEREGAHRVQASTDLANVSMRRLLERLGSTYEGVLRGSMPSASGPRDHAMYGVRVSDWAGREAPGSDVERVAL